MKKIVLLIVICVLVFSAFPTISVSASNIETSETSVILRKYQEFQLENKETISYSRKNRGKMFTMKQAFAFEETSRFLREQEDQGKLLTDDDIDSYYKKIVSTIPEPRFITVYVPKAREYLAGVMKYGHTKTIRARNMAANAVKMTVRYFGRSGRNDKSDAFRHTFWNAEMTRNYGAGFAYDIATNHEKFNSGPAIEEKMDLHNNRIGRGIKTRHFKDLPGKVLNELRKGKMLYIKHSRLIATNR